MGLHKYSCSFVSNKSDDQIIKNAYPHGYKTNPINPSQLNERHVLKFMINTYGMIRSESLTKLSATGKSFSTSMDASATGSSTSFASAGGASRVAAERAVRPLMDAGAKAEALPAAAAMMKAENFIVVVYKEGDGVVQYEMVGSIRGGGVPFAFGAAWRSRILFRGWLELSSPTSCVDV